MHSNFPSCCAKHPLFYANSSNFSSWSRNLFPVMLTYLIFWPRCTKPEAPKDSDDSSGCITWNVCLFGDANLNSTWEKIFTIFNFPTRIFSQIERWERNHQERFNYWTLLCLKFEDVGVQSWVWLDGRINWQNFDFVPAKTKVSWGISVIAIDVKWYDHDLCWGLNLKPQSWFSHYNLLKNELEETKRQNSFWTVIGLINYPFPLNMTDSIS